MKEYVTDTHAVLWHILGNKRLSKQAANIFNNADKGEIVIYIPTIVLIEIIYLIERVKVPKKTIDRVLSLLDANPINYKLITITLGTIQQMMSIARNQIPDMPDRILAASAMDLSLPLITKDEKIKQSKYVEVVW